MILKITATFISILLLSNADAQMKNFNTQGHRGARGNMPENTVSAMKFALDAGVTTLELDVVISKDSLVVVSHDLFFSSSITTMPNGDTIKPSEQKKYSLYKMDYEEIRKYYVGMKLHPLFPYQKKIPEYKPLLSELIDSCEVYSKQINRKPPFYNIEIKSKPSADNIYHPEISVFSELVVNVIQSKHIENRINIQSFDARPLQYLHQHYSTIALSYLVEEKTTKGFEEDIKLLGFIPNYYSPQYSLVTQSLVKDCHAKGIQIIPWTVNDTAMISKLKTMGVDGMISDYPNLLLK